MMQVVLDANILASGAVAPGGGTLATLIELWQRSVFSVAISLPILRVLENAFSDPYFLNRLSPEDIASYLTMVQATTTVVPVTEEVHGVVTHPEDDLILATAVSARADYLVTGDAKLQRLATYEGVAILSPRAFLDILIQAGEQGAERTQENTEV
jgi:putative PIN family toxin of toxin-antitoxin system